MGTNARRILIPFLLLTAACVPEGDETPDDERPVLTTCPGNYQIDRWDTEGDLALISRCPVIEGDLRISMTDLDHLDELSNLAAIGGFLHIGGLFGASYQYSLQNIDGLGNIVSIGRYLIIDDQVDLTALGMDSLTTVGENLTISENWALCTSVAEDFADGVEVGGEISIFGNKEGC